MLLPKTSIQSDDWDCGSGGVSTGLTVIVTLIG